MATVPKQIKMHDERLSFEPPYQWQKDRPTLLGTDYTVIRSNGTIVEQPKLIEFDLTSPKSFIPGPMSKLVIRGGFQVKPPTEAGAAGIVWRKAEKADATKVCLAPLWMDCLIKECSLFSQNTKITSFQEARFITPYLNMLLYRLMDKTMKKVLGPQEASPIYGIPDWKKDSWDIENETHKKYVEHLFDQTMVDFDYTPLLMWPFHQNANGSFSKLVPIPMLPKLTLRIAFQDDQSCIFRKKTATDQTEYKFSFTEAFLILEETRLSPNFEKILLTSKRNLTWPGVTRLQLVEPISTGLSTYKTRFQNIQLPESLLIFAVHRDVASGTFNFSKSTDKNVFKMHNIQTLQISFQQKQFYIREPFPTQITDDRFRTKHYLDRLFHPICGIPVDVESLKEDYFIDGGKNTAYPHIYVNLLNFGSKSRLLPALADDSVLNQKADLEIDFKFNNNGAAADACYVIYAIYTDYAISYDAKNKIFSNPYSAIIN